MHKQAHAPRLSTRVRHQLLGMGAALFVLSVVLILLFTLRVTDSVFVVAEGLEAELLLEELAANPSMPLPRQRTLSAYRVFEEIPSDVRELFQNAPPRPREILQSTSVDESNQQQELVYLSFHKIDGGQELYLLSRYPADRTNRLFSRWLWSVSGQILLVTSVSFVLLFLLMRWLIRRTTEPLRLLYQWAERLADHPAEIRHANFPIEELNELAAQIRQGVEKVEAYNQREESFLRYASHELRTPVAIIQASMDTLALQAPPKSKAALARAQRASDRMQQLITSLLCLARDPDRAPRLHEVDVAVVARQCLSDLQWIAERRGLAVDTDLQSFRLLTEETLLSIVISNLIRNAFSHGSEGVVNLRVDHRGLRMTNPSVGDPADCAESTGLGLLLVERICERLHWRYRFEQKDTQVIVSIDWRLQRV